MAALSHALGVEAMRRAVAEFAILGRDLHAQQAWIRGAKVFDRERLTVRDWETQA